ncbi:hypothetical protein BJY04DRAFT_216240 [Aspergillus karnatakaensis]|uniref:DUF3716 domain-containing protein n=1 Tax=Aspergillus karnatakaensis TaxID=1810916 RepID=UPI003CCE3503
MAHEMDTSTPGSALSRESPSPPGPFSVFRVSLSDQRTILHGDKVLHVPVSSPAPHPEIKPEPDLSEGYMNKGPQPNLVLPVDQFGHGSNGPTAVCTIASSNGVEGAPNQESRSPKQEESRVFGSDREGVANTNLELPPKQLNRDQVSPITDAGTGDLFTKCGAVLSATQMSVEVYTDIRALLKVPHEILPGISSDDLPLPPSGELRPEIEYWVGRPVLRKLDWQQDENGRPIRTLHSNMGAFHAAFVQTRGKLAEIPCTRCAEGKGQWKLCVVGEKNDTPGDEVCANCRGINNWQCSHRSSCSDTPPADNIPPHTTSESPHTPVRTPPRQRASKHSPTCVQPSRASRSPNSKSAHMYGQNYIAVRRRGSGHTKKSPVRAQSQRTPRSTKVEPHRPAQTRIPSRHDGSLVPFPLAPDMFNNLNVLKEALNDQQRHMEIIQQRIRQLERDELEKTATNPWDLLSCNKDCV